MIDDWRLSRFSLFYVSIFDLYFGSSFLLGYILGVYGSVFDYCMGMVANCIVYMAWTGVCAEIRLIKPPWY